MFHDLHTLQKFLHVFLVGDIASFNAVFREAVRRDIIDCLFDISDFVYNSKTQLFMRVVKIFYRCLHHLLP
jgi:hypothetical protein